MLTDEMVDAAELAFLYAYDGPGSETAAHRAGLAAVYPAIRAEVLREAAGVARDMVLTNRRAALTCINGSREKIRLLDEGNAAASIERAILALAQEADR